MRILLTAATIVLTLTGCYSIHPPRKPWVAGAEHDDPSFRGIRHSLANRVEARLLIMHGMGIHGVEFDDKFRERLAAKLGVKLDHCDDALDIENPDDPHNVYGSVRICEYKDGAKVLRTYSLLWSPLTTPYKKAGLGYDWEQPYRKWRVALNRRVKRQLIDESFSDAVLYSGRLAPKMRYSVRQALCATMTDERNLKDPCPETTTLTAGSSDVFVATHSLGSIMMFETIAEEHNNVARQFIERLKLVGMMANQLPLITLSRLDVPPHIGGGAQLDFAPLFANRKRTDKITVAAFTDVNDLLSFTIPEDWKSVLFSDYKDRFHFINFPVTNSRYAIAFAVAGPIQAHTGYWENDAVINALADGYTP